VRQLRSHGLINRETALDWGMVSRLETIQAAGLLTRLEGLGAVIERRRASAAIYRCELDPRATTWAPCRDPEFNTFHTFIVEVEGGRRCNGPWRSAESAPRSTIRSRSTST